jgi:uncharacterized membrane protein
MSDGSARTFTADFRRFFLRGLVILLPSVLTLWIVVKAYQFVDNTIAEPINRSVRLAMVNTAKVWEPLRDVFDPTPEALSAALEKLPPGKRTEAKEATRARLRAENITAWWSEHWAMDLIGIIVAIVAVYISGRLLGGFVGRRLYRRIEQFITTLPVFKQVYPYVKQIVDFLFSDDQPIKFNRVVAVPYPRKGVWSVGFMTGETLRSIQECAGDDAVTVFIPSSPTPFTGYTVTVRRKEIIELPISVDEAIRFAVSGGVLIPEHQRIGGSTVPAGDGLPSGLVPLPGSNQPREQPAVATASAPPKETPEPRTG